MKKMLTYRDPPTEPIVAANRDETSAIFLVDSLIVVTFITRKSSLYCLSHDQNTVTSVIL